MFEVDLHILLRYITFVQKSEQFKTNMFILSSQFFRSGLINLFHTDLPRWNCIFMNFSSLD